MTKLRHVRHLRFRCAREEHARHGRVLLEDALRTATLEEGAQVVVVRRLDLGTIGARASATHWSQRLEQSYRVARHRPVRFDHPQAANAEAVAFADATEPWLQLAVRAATRQTCTEWFWRAATPGWQPNMSPPDVLRLCFRSLVASGGLRLTLVLAARLQAQAALPALLRVLQRDDVTSLQSVFGTTSVARAASALPETATPSLAAEERALVASWAEDDPRVLWLAAAYITGVTTHNAPGAIVAIAAPEQIHAVAQNWRRASPPTPGYTTPDAPASIARDARGLTPPPTRGYLETPEAARKPQGEEWPESDFTQIGGLFYIVPLLVRAGLPDFLAGLSPKDRTLYPWHVFRAFCRHARARDDDALRRTLADLPMPSPHVGRWLLAAQRIALRQAQMNVREIITRPARIMLSPTHIDISFRPNEADIRLRRAGLDVDPGWVPWLGRAIAFHFDRED